MSAVLQLPQAGSAGEIVRTRQVSGFILTETAYPSGFEAPPHAHELGYFFTVLDGSYTERLGGTTREYPLHILGYRPAGLAHAHASPRGGRCFNIHPAAEERFSECRYSLRAPLEIRSALAPWLLARLYHEFALAAEVSPLTMEGLALEILAEGTRPAQGIPTSRPPRWLEKARELLHDRFNEGFTIEEVARTVGRNPAYLCRVFREQYRCTIGDYVRRLRVEDASRRLCASEAPLAEIALDAGFVDQSHFTRTFKRHTGMTPARFRAAARRR